MVAGIASGRFDMLRNERIIGARKKTTTTTIGSLQKNRERAQEKNRRSGYVQGVQP